MPAASNTSPILNLAIIGQLALLREQFKQVWIAPAVLEELRIEEDRPGSQVVREAMAVGWLQVEQVKDQKFVQVLQRELDRGEAEAIALALQMNAEWTLLDERDGRRVAKSLGLKVTGVLGILLRASHEGKVASLQSAIQDLQDKAGFRIGAELLDEILKADKAHG